MNSKMDPMGRAIADYFKNKKASKLRVFSPMFEEDEIPLTTLFRSYDCGRRALRLLSENNEEMSFIRYIADENHMFCDNIPFPEILVSSWLLVLNLVNLVEVLIPVRLTKSDLESIKTRTCPLVVLKALH